MQTAAAHLHVRLEIALEARVQDLALARLQAVEHVGDRALEVRTTEEDELTVHKVVVADLLGGVVQEGAGLEVAEPLLARIDLLLAERELDAVAVRVACMCAHSVALIRAAAAACLLGNSQLGCEVCRQRINWLLAAAECAVHKHTRRRMQAQSGALMAKMPAQLIGTPSQVKVFLWCESSAKYSFASLLVLVPRPL